MMVNKTDSINQFKGKRCFELVLLLPLIFSCSPQQGPKYPDPTAPKITEAKGHLVMTDSMPEPKVILIDEGKLRKVVATKPRKIPSNTNVVLAGKPIVVPAGKQTVVTPGLAGFSRPKEIAVTSSPFLAGIPEVVVAKAPSVKDQNSQNFSSFGKLQGLRHGNVSCMIEDRSGNLWFGTNGGGASRFDGRSFTHFTTETGLGNNVVWSMVEDRNGNMWFATYGGISRYDGRSFTQFSEVTGAAWTVIEDKNGNLWFGTDEGAWKYDGKIFTHFTKETGLCNNSVRAIVEDQSGDLWFGTDGGGVSMYDGKHFFNLSEKEGLGDNLVWSILEDRIGNLWFATGGGVSKYDGKSFSHFTDKEGLSSISVLAILEDTNGNIWFGTDSGVSKYDGTTFTHYDEKDGLSNNDIWSILEDSAGNLWFGTFTGGVSRYDGRLFTHLTEREGLGNRLVFSVLEDQAGQLWFGTIDGGAAMYDGNSFSHFTSNEGLSANVIWSMVEDRSGNLWFGTDVAGVTKYDGRFFTQFTEKDGLSNNGIWSILEDQHGNIWFGTNGGGVTKYDGKSFTHFTKNEGLSHNVVRSVVEDKSGNLWFGTNGGGVTRYDGKHFTHFTTREGLSNNAVLSIEEDRSGNLWFGTFGGGVTKFDGKVFSHFTEREGLSSNFVLSVLEDKSGALWFGTRLGLSRLSKRSLDGLSNNIVENRNELFKKFAYEDGFLGIGCSPNSICEDKTGAIWIGANDRLTVYHPDGEWAPHSGESESPNIQLTNLELFNENIEWINLEHKIDTSFVLGNGVEVGNLEFEGISKWYGLPEALSLAHNNNYLTFSFIGITQLNPKRVKYQYKLEGNDANWSAITTSTLAPYGNLMHGAYTFKVKALSSEGHWSDELHYKFEIRPPWWKTWWAYASYSFAIFGAAWYYIRWREESLKERQNELEQLVTIRTSEVVEEKKEVERQKTRSDELLLNILPSEVAEELKLKGNAQAKLFDEVTVMFTDFKNFTQISETLTPAELVAEIHIYFKAFDTIISKFPIEKIKTIGDSYMCVGGLPVVNRTSASDVISASLEIREFVQNLCEQRTKEGRASFEIRIGIHTGPVVAGIVGIKKFAYDIWGDTVNIASRMESSGEVGKVNVSGSTYELVKGEFDCTYRGKIQAKNKGEIDMYFVESRTGPTGPR